MNKIDQNELKKSLKILKALDNPIRFKIMEALQDNPAMTVTEIIFLTRKDQSLVSQHLAILYKAGYLSKKKEGKNVYYSLNNNKLKRINELIRKIID